MLCSDSSFFTELWNFRLPFSVFLYYHKHFNDIMNALNYGITASEQLGELRLVFQHIVAKDKYYSRKNDIEDAIKAINLSL